MNYDFAGALARSGINFEGLTGCQPLFYHWIMEREKCRVGRENGLPKPWTDDPILQNYRFCNVRREDDVVTKWIHANWMLPNEQGDPKRLVVAMVVARTVNCVATLQEIGFPWRDFEAWKHMAKQKMKARRERGEQVWTGAYLVSTNGNKMDKIDYIAECVWQPIHDGVRAPIGNERLEVFHSHLQSFDGMGTFMAGQVIADLKFSNVLKYAPDWDTWAPIGPGSKRGLNRYFDRRPIERNIPDKQVLEELNGVKLQVQARLGLDLAVHNIQNCFCEFDKYCRVYNEEGKPRSRYNGKRQL